MIYRASAGVAVCLHKKHRSWTNSNVFVNEKTLTIRLKVEGGHITIISIYVPEEERTEETIDFYEILQDVIHQTDNSDYLILLEDLNARMGNNPTQNIIGMKAKEW